MYYGRRRRYKEKKRKPPDLELLGYDHNKLLSVIEKTTKELTCSRCLHTQNIYGLDIYSGQYGIYCKCDGCSKNLSIPAKIDLESDDKLNDLTKSIEDFRKNLKDLKKNFNKVSEIQEEIRLGEKKEEREINEKIERKKEEWQKTWLARKNICFSPLDRSVFRGIGELTGLVEKDYTDMVGEKGDGTWMVKKGNERNFELRTKELALLSKQQEALERKTLNFVYGPHPWNAQKVEEKYKGAYIFLETYCRDSEKSFLDPTNLKDLEIIEEVHLKPLIDKKEKRILLLRKIFRTSKGSVYVLENDSMPDFYKIGWTDRSPEERAKELSGTGVPTPYRVAYSKSTNLTAEVEKEIHNKLDKFRPRSNREFFKIDLETIKKTIHDTLEI